MSNKQHGISIYRRRAVRQCVAKKRRLLLGELAVLAVGIFMTAVAWWVLFF